MGANEPESTWAGPASHRLYRTAPSAEKMDLFWSVQLAGSGDRGVTSGVGHLESDLDLTKLQRPRAHALERPRDVAVAQERHRSYVTGPQTAS